MRLSRGRGEACARRRALREGAARFGTAVNRNRSRLRSSEEHEEGPAGRPSKRLRAGRHYARISWLRHFDRAAFSRKHSRRLQRLCRAYGAWFSVPGYPALPGWANFCRTSGADSGERQRSRATFRISAKVKGNGYYRLLGIRELVWQLGWRTSGAEALKFCAAYVVAESRDPQRFSVATQTLEASALAPELEVRRISRPPRP
jgi:hypothetical protein